MSETSIYREELAKYCEGYGADLGYGGDPIIPSAITMDMPVPYTKLGQHPLNLGGDARDLIWFANNSLDYIYSSHLLEDFENTKEILLEWMRVLKKGGKLILLLPDQQRYEEHCRKHNYAPNAAHKIKNFSLQYIKQQISQIPNTKIIYEKDCTDSYSFISVIEKIGDTPICCKNCKELEANINKMNQALEIFAEDIKRKGKELHDIRSSLRWKIPNYFFKLYKKTIE